MLYRASGYRIDNGYLSNYKDELLIMCPVEYEEGVKKIEEIIAVNGVDCVQMGPLDLSASMGGVKDVKRFKSKAVSNDEDLDSIEIDKDSEEKYWSE
ncbi:aldehyde-lyase domain-containing protein [Tanacetum coccineum]